MSKLLRGDKAAKTINKVHLYPLCCRSLTMSKWVELPFDLIVLIATRIKVIEDFIAFGAVCTSWQAAATKHNFDVFSPQVPLLMLECAKSDDDYREFYSLSKKKVSRIFLPELRGAKCLPSKGWLCTVSRTGNNLLHPFSRINIKLPSLKPLLPFHGRNAEECWYCFKKAVLSASPSLTSDYVLVVSYYKCGTRWAFWRPGDLNWTPIDTNEYDRVVTMIYYKGKFYFVAFCGRLWVFDVAGPSITQPIVKPFLLVEIKVKPYQSGVSGVIFRWFYLVEVSGALLLVTRFVRLKDKNDLKRGCESLKFEVYELNVIKGEGELKEEIKTLGDSTIFLGRNGASCIDSSKFTGVKPNHIYFVDDSYNLCKELEECFGGDMGAYNLKDGKIQYFYRGLSTSPAWVTPSF